MIFYKVTVKLQNGGKRLFEGPRIHELLFDIDRQYGPDISVIDFARFIREPNGVVRPFDLDNDAPRPQGR